MPLADIDFEGAAQQTGSSGAAQSTENGGNNNATQEDMTHLNGNNQEDITSKDGANNNNGQQEGQSDDTGKDGNQNNQDDNNSSTGELAVGDTLEFEGSTYTVDKNGNLVDDKGSIFKQANEVSDWLKSMDVDDNNQVDGGLNLASIQEALGITVTDSDGKAVEFTDDADGVKAYVNSVIDLKSNELQTAAINKLYSDNPLLKQFNDYVQLTGTPRGFGEIPDRSGIQVEKDNEAQQVAIIRMAAQEFGNKSLNENYIKYLRDSGGLYDEARNQLQALAEKDIAVRKEIETRAATQRQEEAENVANYWKNVSNVIDGRMIAGYKLPESFTKEVNGQKVVITPNDFYNYLSKASEQDADGNRVTGYQKDLSNLSDADYLNRELLDAWLMFTGGTYKDLIDMAVKEDKVRQLRVKSKEQRTAKSVKIIRKANSKTDINDIIL
nr:MAG TPA: hypothetical protein [Crassvirales sp.]